MKQLPLFSIKPLSDARGGALVEFALVIPVLILFLLGILSAGRLLTQVQNANQATYLAASLGAELDSSLLEAGVQERLRQIIYLHRKRVDDIGGDAIRVSVTEEATPDQPAESVRVQMTAQLPELLQRFTISSDFTMPRVPQIVIPAGLETPANPNGLYTCSGVRTGCNDASCNAPCY